MVEKKMLIGELIQGRELAAQLNQLDPVESREACQALVEKIVSTYDKALSMLKLKGMKRCADQVETFHQTSAGHTTKQALMKDNDFRKEIFKKRKTELRWNEEMSVFSGDGGEESPKEDGHHWRKYGQKDILGAKFPRAYYRCTHRKTQGCLATKKVQRADNGSSIFQISYKGRHTCISNSSSSMDIPIITANTISSNINPSSSSSPSPSQSSMTDFPRFTATQPSDALRNLQQGLKIETEHMNRSKEEIFNFSSVSFESEFFSKLLKEEDEEETEYPDLVDRYSPVFLSSKSTTASESDFIQFDWQLNDYGLSSGVFPSSESDPSTADMNLTPTSAFESPFTDLDF